METLLIYFLFLACVLGFVSGTTLSGCPTHCSCLSDECVSCSGGYWGSVCQNTCTPNCCYGGACVRCDFEDGHCESCKAGYWGTTCEEKCTPNCCYGGTCPRCAFKDGTCDGCKAGYWGSTCVNVCTPNCCYGGTCPRCAFKDGTCDSCKAGSWGTTCEEKCTPNCCYGGTCPRCALKDGTCDSCKGGWWGTTCENQCSPNCAKNGLCGQCAFKDGSCSSCCHGYTGSQCDIPPTLELIWTNGKPLPPSVTQLVEAAIEKEANQLGWTYSRRNKEPFTDGKTEEKYLRNSVPPQVDDVSSSLLTVQLGVFATAANPKSEIATEAVKACIKSALMKNQILPEKVKVLFNGEDLW
jgi:hypothetical protein